MPADEGGTFCVKDGLTQAECNNVKPGTHAMM
jgi:hypothetical protein